MKCKSVNNYRSHRIEYSLIKYNRKFCFNERKFLKEEIFLFFSNKIIVRSKFEIEFEEKFCSKIF